MVSNIIGQKRQEEVIPLVWRISKISFLISLIIVIVLNIMPGVILSVYQQGDSFIADAIPVVRVVSIALLLMSFSTVWLNAVTGTGNTVVNLTIEAITIVLYCIYVYVILVHLFLSVSWGWASEIVYWISMFSMAFWYMKFGTWRKKII
jgi:Na+-driven multidrug efflux pump